MFIRPNDLKNMVGRCNVCVYEKEDTYRTEVTTERGETYICKCGALFPNIDSVSWQPEGKQAIRFADLKGLKKIVKDAAKSECKLQLITEAGSKSVGIVSHACHCDERDFEYSVSLSEPANYSCIVWIKPEILIPFFGNWTGELFIKSVFSAFVLGSQSGYNLLMPVGPDEGKEVKEPEYSIEPAPIPPEPVPLSNWQIIAAIWLLGLFAIGRRFGIGVSPVSPRINEPSAVHSPILFIFARSLFPPTPPVLPLSAEPDGDNLYVFYGLSEISLIFGKIFSLIRRGGNTINSATI